MIYIVIVALSVVLLLFLTIVPGRGKNKKWAFYGRNIAHRGLYLLDQSIPENSLPAFQRGRDAGYAMELDVQLSKDGKLVVFHDDTLERACGKQGRVDAFSFQELSEMHLFGTDERSYRLYMNVDKKQGILRCFVFDTKDKVWLDDTGVVSRVECQYKLK